MRARRSRILLLLSVLWIGALGACARPTTVGPIGGSTNPTASSGGSTSPVEIRIGHGFAAEENLWLMKAKPELAPNQDRLYRLTFTAFRGNADRLSAYEAGQLNGGTISAPTALFSTEQGMPLKLVASVVRERPGYFNTTFLALSDAGIRGPADARGKTVGIVDFKSATELWARAALETAGLEPERDYKLVIVPFPAMGEALRSRRIDVGVFPDPFATIEQRRGGVVDVWTSKTGVPFEEELLFLFLRPEFIAQHRDAARAFLADFVNTTRWYVDHLAEARQALLDSPQKFVQTEPELYLQLKDSYRDPTGRINLEALQQQQEMFLKLGWMERRLDLNALVDLSLLPQ